ncbi:MAG: hypothetical protein GY820_06505 [Gammaproteobacteria bacterium]|nr:hypothetical protein [Gammaproteobacteria bacterium]
MSSSDTLLILNSNCATFPNGRSRLEADFSFRPPITQLSGQQRYIAVSDFQLETGGLLYEAPCQLEFMSTRDKTWQSVPNSRFIYCRSLDGLVEKLNALLTSIARIRGRTPTKVPNLPTVEIGVDKDGDDIIVLSSNGYGIRFNRELARLMDFDETNVSGDMYTLKQRTKVVSTRNTETLELPRTWAVYLSLQDVIEPNAIVPMLSGESRREAILYYVDLSPDEHKYETVSVHRPTWCRLTRSSIHTVRLAVRYAASGNVVRTLGHGDDLHVALIERKRLCLSL